MPSCGDAHPPPVTDYTKIARSLDLADPTQGAARTPDVVDAVWWLTLPEAQACAELGITADLYPKVARAIEPWVTAYLNRKAQGTLHPTEGAPVIKRKLTKRTAALFQGGRVRRIGSPRR